MFDLGRDIALDARGSIQNEMTRVGAREDYFFQEIGRQRICIQFTRCNSVRDLSNESTLVSRFRDFARLLLHCAMIERSCVSW